MSGPARTVSVAAVLVGVVALAGAAWAEPVSCQRTIAKEASKLVNTRLKTVRACEEKKLRGKLPESTECLSETKTAQKIAKAESKARAKIGKSCGGGNRICGVGDTGLDADDSLSSIGWDIGTCPDLENAGCTNTIDDCNEVSDCLVCVNDAGVDQLIDVTFGSFDPGLSVDVLNCQLTLGREATNLLAEESKTLRACQEEVLKNKISGPCPVPGNEKTGRKLDQARNKFVAKTCKKCGGDDGECGTGDDLLPSVIGAPAGCPAVTAPDGTACGASIDTLQDLVDCVLCISEFKSTCLDANAVPGVKSYPIECNAPTPTPTLTPTPTPTFTPRASQEAIDCQRTIVEETALLAQKRANALQFCEERKVKNFLPSSTNCETEADAAAKIATAESIFRTQIEKDCGGANNTCDALDQGNDADPTLFDIGWDIGTCQNFEGGGCDNVIADCGDVIDCINCVVGDAVDQEIDLLYGSLEPSTTGTELNDCQVALGDEMTIYFEKASVALRRCEDSILKDEIPGPCPDPGDGDALDKLSDAQATMIDMVCNQCGGADNDCGGLDDLSPTAVGFSASCSDVTIPGGVGCAGPITSFDDLLTCADCVTQFKFSCLDHLAVPGLKPYPSECSGAVAQPTPTPTTTPGGGGTATPTPMSTGPTPTPVCGNDVVEAGEDCDDGNTLGCDACSVDCQAVPTCDAGSETVTVSADYNAIAVATATAIDGCIVYDGGRVSLPTVVGQLVSPARSTIAPSGSTMSVLDFEHSAVERIQNPTDPQANYQATLTFDVCTGSGPPAADDFDCQILLVADGQGNELPPEQASLVTCALGIVP